MRYWTAGQSSSAGSTACAIQSKQAVFLKPEMRHTFPEPMEETSAEAVESRLWSGLHFRSDLETS